MSMLTIAMSPSKHSPKPVLSSTAKSVKQYEYLQAMTVILGDIFDSCNGRPAARIRI
jgi:hypothetical protein